MSETLKKQERSGVEGEFDKLWSPVYDLYNSIYSFTYTHRINWGLDSESVPRPVIEVSDAVPENIDTLSDEQITDLLVNVESPVLVAKVVMYARYRSLLLNLEARVRNVNQFLNFDPEKTIGFSNSGKGLFLHGNSMHGMYGYFSSERRTVRLFGFTKDGLHAYVKRFGDTEDDRLDCFRYNEFCYGPLPDFKPTLDSGDYKVVQIAQIVGEGQFS